MKIGTKIILGFSAPILMFIAFGIWLQLVTAGISDNLKHVKKQMPLSKALEIMENSVKRGEIDPHLFELFKARKIYERFSNRERSDADNSASPASDNLA